MEPSTRSVVSGFMVGLAIVCLTAARAAAYEAGQGSFTVTLGMDFQCANGGGTFTTTITFDDKTFHVNLPPGNNQLDINFSVLGGGTAAGRMYCLFDEGGRFSMTAVTQAGDFQWTEISGEYMDHVPGLSQGDPFPFVGTARCTTTRTDEFKTLCDNFELSFNGLAKALPPVFGFFPYYGGDFTLRAVPKTAIGPSPEPSPVVPPVDGENGDVPDVAVDFKDGIETNGELRVATLADVHGTFPSSIEFPVRGRTQVDHGTGPRPFFAGGDERFIDITTDAGIGTGKAIEVCLPMPRTADATRPRPVRLLHGEGGGPIGRMFVDRTSRLDLAARKVCGKVATLSKFAVVTSDVCGGGQLADGLLTVAGGLVGSRTIVVDGLTDCTQYPSRLPQGLQKYCVPDADPTAGRCGMSLTLGINRGGCNRVRSGVDPHSTAINVNSYRGTLTQGRTVRDLTALFGPLIAALSNPNEATVGPATVSMAATTKITTYKLTQQLTGFRPGTTASETDKDVMTIQCLDPSRY